MNLPRKLKRKTRVLAACASFKGTLSSRQAGQAVARGLKALGVRTEVVALADGGEGLVEALARAVPGAKLCSTVCHGPLGERRRAKFALLPPGAGRKAKTAVLEMAASSGLPLVPERKRDPKRTTTWGVGEQVRAALDKGARAILLGIGGSATNDAGAGMAQALGARLLDAEGRDLPPGGAALLRLKKIDLARMDRRLRHVPVTVACDVENPLCGPRGASAVYGPQKGATPADVRLLDRALANFARVTKRDLGKHVRNVRGAGAAGGLGAGSLAFLNARLTPGIELVLDAVGFDARVRGADMVVTGEGMLDRQTLMGKAPAGVAFRAKKARVPCAAIGGGVDRIALAQLKKVFAQVESLSAFAGSPAKAKARAAFWLEQLARARGAAWLAATRGKRRS
ncbi:MAG: glycerate kinase [Planctomycetes bacterium]|nr:glycerate kinase [Planctomycetota bacterium]